MIDQAVCPHCHGAGTVQVMDTGIFGLFRLFNTRTCSGCNGRGYVIVAAKEKK